MYSHEERKLLEKLSSGVLDGMVGDERVYRVYRSVYCGKEIRNGVPIFYRQNGSSSEMPVGKKTIQAFPEREEDIFDTDERKLEFLQRFGWLMDDEDVKAYSAKYKPKRCIGE